MTQTYNSGDRLDHEKIPEEKYSNKALDRREMIHEITQPTRFDLIQDILMHPEQMPSMKEFAFLQPEKATSTIREHLDRLIKLDIVKEVSLEQERVKRDNPRKFFTLTERGRDELEKLDLLSIEDPLQYLYANTEKPEVIVKYEEAPRPKDDSTD